MEEEITRRIRASFVGYWLNKHNVKVAGRLKLEKAMKRYEIEYKRYLILKKKGELQ